MQKGMRYTLVKEIGSGTFGRVYQADVHCETKLAPQTVAVKRVAWTATDGVPRTTMREVTYLQRVSHPNIVRLLRVYRHSDAIDLLLELWNDNLHLFVVRMRELSKRDELCWCTYADMATRMMAQLASALAHCHAQGVMHRDVKPCNILLTPTQDVKLADFGAATSTSTSHVQHVGETTTLWYRAPEQLLGETQDTPAVDGWSLAMVIYEMMYLGPLLPGMNEKHQLALCFEFAGPPTPESWQRGFELLIAHGPVDRIPPTRRARPNVYFEALAEAGESLTIPNPERRMTCAQAAHILGELAAINE